MSRHKFNATKGEAFHINIDPDFGYLPLIKRVPYEKKESAESLLRSNLIEQLLKNRNVGY